MVELDDIQMIADKARDGATFIRNADAAQKNKALHAAAAAIRANAAAIIAVNAKDVAIATSREMSSAMLDRLTLNDERIEGIAAAVEAIAAFDDPIGEAIDRRERPNGLVIERVRAPIGVLGIIYESRPNVTIDAAALAMKSGNAAILRGGSECLNSSLALFDCFRAALVENGIPDGVVQLIDSPDRNYVGVMLGGLDGVIDLIVPRGGKSLVARVQTEARVPVLSHMDGMNTIYIDQDANLEKAINICVNSKMRRPSVCGAAETILIASPLAPLFLPELATQLINAGCVLRGDKMACAIDGRLTAATREDWVTEYLAPIISIAIVEHVDGAIAHIGMYSSHHTDAIVTENTQTAQRFIDAVDSAIIMHNASTQFADGGEFGLGAEIGIATGRLHARGPVGVRELTTYKNIVRGTGQVRP